MAWNRPRYEYKRPPPPPPVHDAQMVGADLRNGQDGWRCTHCQRWQIDFFQGTCPVLERRERARARRFTAMRGGGRSR